MIHVNSIENALFTTLSSDQTLVNSGVNVTLNEPDNSDPALLPHVGVQYADHIIEPHVSNITQPWMMTIQFRILLQSAYFSNGQLAHDALARLLTPVMTAIDSNRTLDNTVDLIVRFENDREDFDPKAGDSFFQHVITLTAEKRV